jgi:hypothetical protein
MPAIRYVVSLRCGCLVFQVPDTLERMIGDISAGYLPALAAGAFPELRCPLHPGVHDVVCVVDVAAGASFDLIPEPCLS